MSNIIPFSFEQHAVRTIEQDGQAWFVLNDVTEALEFTRGRDAARMLDDDERCAHIVRVRSESGVEQDREVTVINESGLYSLILKSRKPSAKRFKKWVTAEVLPAIRKTGSYAAPATRQPKALPGLSHDQQDAIKGLVKARVEALPQSKQAKAAITCWSALKSKFGCTYKEIEPAQFAEALSLVARLPLEGELLDAEPAKPVLELNYPARAMLDMNPHLRGHEPHRFHLRAGDLCGMDARSPTLGLLAELARAGYDVEGCKLEVLAMRHHLETLTSLSQTLQRLGDNSRNAAVGIRF